MLGLGCVFVAVVLGYIVRMALTPKGKKCADLLQASDEPAASLLESVGQPAAAGMEQPSATSSGGDDGGAPPLLLTGSDVAEIEGLEVNFLMPASLSAGAVMRVRVLVDQAWLYVPFQALDGC